MKKRLQAIEGNDWKIPEVTDIYGLALEAMDSIGSTDPVLRDDLALTYLWAAITEGMLTKEQLRELLDISLSEKYLFCKSSAEEGM